MVQLKYITDCIEGMTVMELVKITSKGQLTLPAKVRRKLNLQNGGKLAFVERDGIYYILNPVALAVAELQKNFEGEAERLELKTEADVVAMVKEVRQGMWVERNANNG